MATLLRVPEVAAGATEAVLAEWLVPEKGSFSTGDPLVTLETDKALVEVEAENDAILLRVLVPNGTTIEVGAPMALLGDPAERDADPDHLLAELGVTSATTPPAIEPPATGPLAQEPPTTPPTPVPPAAPAGGDRVFSSPLARRILREAGLSTDHVRGTGPNGRIVRRDAERAVEEARRAKATSETQAAPPLAVPTGPSAPPVTPTAVAVPTWSAGVEQVPHSRLRRAVAERLTASKREVPHFYVRRTVVIDDLLGLRRRLNEVAPRKVSVNDLVVKAAACAHEAVPEANAVWTDEHMLRFTSSDVSVAIASGRGLVTPVLRDVGALAPSAIARQVRSYAERADAGTLRQEDLEGGSLTVTNLGMFGVEEFSAIINPPQSMILAVGAARPEPVVVDGEVTVATRMALTVSVDHRAIDGALAARWMTALVENLEQPLRLMA
ncbi:dihydrolipoamide acetyltransferase family protein [Streptomyces sp. TS71-3]|uniref:dihydrolipoamide acetyltransferase family protein n=1 Tax=Streptomyces sp. TS71-3 TaxID=2733862 RepID=UPI001B29622C|nr:dihydrolipoamide acetyltransferase family protein [Streptomyces sp. TS71-3]GHJ38488.1 acetyltransferase component of pyruvate dehydrogenase complex [Streptomyces sp. TS71-3]